MSGESIFSQPGCKCHFLSSLIGAGGIVAVFVISSRISKPISILADSCKQQDVQKLEKITLKTDDEINDVTNALNNMIEKVNEVGKMKIVPISPRDKKDIGDMVLAIGEEVNPISKLINSGKFSETSNTMLHCKIMLIIYDLQFGLL